MSHDFQSVLISKQTYRRQLAARPIGEKLRMLDALRERELGIRGHGARPTAVIALHDAPNSERTESSSSANRR